MRRMQFAVAGALVLISAVVGQSLEPTFQTDPMVASELDSTEGYLGAEQSSEPTSNPETVVATATHSQIDLPFDIRWLVIVPAFVLGMLTHMMIRNFWPSGRGVASAKPLKTDSIESRTATQSAPADSAAKGTLALVARERKKSQQLTDDLAEAQRELRLSKSTIRDLEKRLSQPSQPAPVDQIDDEVGFQSVDQPR